MKHYRLECLKTRTLFDDAPDEHGRFPLISPFDETSLLRSAYSSPLEIGDICSEGIFAFSWLPASVRFACASHPVTFKSTGFARHAGLSNLYFTFSGYRPALGARCISGSFKEFEAVGVFARQGFDTERVLVLASAGNTARAFCEIGSRLGARVLIVLPESQIGPMRCTIPKADSIRIITVHGTYNDAIAAAKKISEAEGFVAEGGARNVGRRDALGTTLLSAVLCMQRIPDHYVQAIGSGSGAISAWEACMRLHELGIARQKPNNSAAPAVWFPPEAGKLPAVHIGQNAPFTPVVDHWNRGEKTFTPFSQAEAVQRLALVTAPVLANNDPPYSAAGGLYEMLRACKGSGYACSSAEAQRAGELFARLEGFTLAPASEVALAALLQARETKKIQDDDYVMVNLTGGTDDELARDYDMQRITADAALPAEPTDADIAAALSQAGLR